MAVGHWPRQFFKFEIQSMSDQQQIVEYGFIPNLATQRQGNVH